MGKTVKPVIDLTGLPKEPAWYLVSTLYNNEDKYAENLKMGLEAKGLADKIIEIFVPIRRDCKEVENRKGVKELKEVRTKILDNYVYVKAIMDESVWDYLRTTAGVATVIAPGGHPGVTSEEDIKKMKILCGQ